MQQERTIDPSAEAQNASASAAAETAPSPETSDRHVPISEAIRHRRRAQQAEVRAKQLEQQVAEMQAQLDGRSEQLATAEAQRDEMQHQFDEQRLKGTAQRILLQSGVSDLETAMLLLERRVAMQDETDEPALQQAVEQLLADKPFLLGGSMGAGRTASPRLKASGPTAKLARAAAQAARTGNRRDIAEYLRLRRRSAT